MASSTIKGYWRQKGSKAATAAVGLQVIQFSFDPTAASASMGKTLPVGAIPLFAQNIDGGATGGTNPTIDIGTSGDPDGFANELDADGATGLINTGALLGTELTADTVIYAGVGASAATGGTVTIGVYFIMSDAG